VQYSTVPTTIQTKLLFKKKKTLVSEEGTDLPILLDDLQARGYAEAKTIILIIPTVDFASIRDYRT
jgi:hypothetical protein